MISAMSNPLRDPVSRSFDKLCPSNSTACSHRVPGLGANLLEPGLYKPNRALPIRVQLIVRTLALPAWSATQEMKRRILVSPSI